MIALLYLMSSMLLTGAGPSGAGVVVPVAEVTTFDFTGLTGAGFVTLGAGKSARLGMRNPAGVATLWFNTGTEEVPTPTDALEVAISASDTDEDLATKFAATLNVAPGVFEDQWTAVAVGAVVTVTDSFAEPRVDAEDVDSGVVVTVTTQGEDA